MYARITTVPLAVLILLAGANRPVTDVDTSHHVSCAKAETFVNLILTASQSDGIDIFERKYNCEDGLLWMWVKNSWYSRPCYEREQLYVAVRTGWRNSGGTNVVMKDRIDNTVATFRVFSSKPKITGCT